VVKPNWKLADREYIVTAYAEHARGPGWSNQIVWVIIGDANGKLRSECLQPSEQSAEVLTLFGGSAWAHGSMARAVERIVKG